MNFEGKFFWVKTTNGKTLMQCIEWSSDRRVFRAVHESGFLDLDWMEFQDQWGLGRIELADNRAQ